MNQVLNKARDDAGNYAQSSLPDTNNVVRMVTAGSKGSFINISQVGLQIAMCVSADTRLPTQPASWPLAESLLGRCLVHVHEQGQPADRA